VSTPVTVYEATARTQLAAPPNYLPAPRASFVFGVDDSAAVYAESYAGASLPVAIRNGTGAVIWSGSVALTPHGSFASGIARVPLAGSDIGILTLTAGSGADTASTPLFVGFGPDLPVLSFDEMLGYLRFFATPDRLQALRNAPPGERAQLWSDFLHRSDPNPETPNNEALDAYFARIREANTRFRSDEGRGWLSDRGTVYVVLGDPDAISEDYAYMYNAGDITSRYGGAQRVRVQIWQYGTGDVGTIVFYDPSDAGQWRLAPQSASVFRSILSRRLVH
jgi:GWxTD domain-containing protein